MIKILIYKAFLYFTWLRVSSVQITFSPRKHVENSKWQLFNITAASGSSNSWGKIKNRWWSKNFKGKFGEWDGHKGVWILNNLESSRPCLGLCAFSGKISESPKLSSLANLKGLYRQISESENEGTAVNCLHTEGIFQNAHQILQQMLGDFRALSI